MAKEEDYGIKSGDGRRKNVHHFAGTIPEAVPYLAMLSLHCPSMVWHLVMLNNNTWSSFMS
jgi:hypothetical protein